MIGLALSGGGSRAIAFHLGCLRALNDVGLLDRVDILSTISGGSVIGAYYAFTPKATFVEFESEIRKFLVRGFKGDILCRLTEPKIVISSMRNVLVATIDAARERLAGQQPVFRGYPSRSDVFCEVLSKQVFANLTMGSPRRRGIEIIIGACELQTGSAFRFGNSKSGSWRFGELINNNVEVSLATAASAAYPLFLPPLDRQWKFRKNGTESEHRVVLTDGGVYDNLGIQALEPRRDPAYSIHTFPCEYLIVCNAGHGQSLDAAPLRLFPRMSRSFTVIHRRVQDSAMNRLHFLLATNRIKGFAMPYLGQQDERLPIRPATLVPRSEVAAYPTDFSPMSETWINKLSDRGEQLTRTLVSFYLGVLM